MDEDKKVHEEVEAVEATEQTDEASEGAVESPITPNYTKIRDDECIPVARELLKMIADAELPMGTGETVSKDEAIQTYNAFYENSVAPFLLEKNIKLQDVSFIFQIMTQAIGLTKEPIDATFDARQDQVVAKVLGVSDITDARIGDLQKVLLEQAKESKSGESEVESTNTGEGDAPEEPVDNIEETE